MTNQTTHTFIALDPNDLQSRVDELLAAIGCAVVEVPVTHPALAMLDLGDLERLAFGDTQFSAGALAPLRDYLAAIPGFEEDRADGVDGFSESTNLHHDAVRFEILNLDASAGVAPADAEVVVVNSILPRD